MPALAIFVLLAEMFKKLGSLGDNYPRIIRVYSEVLEYQVNNVMQRLNVFLKDT